jgi:F420-dependent oxidoreductase-like protein
MRIGLQIPSFTWPGGAAAIPGTLARIATTAEAAGFHSVWVMDHFFQISQVGPPEQEMLEGYSALSYLAGITRTVKLGTMVTGVIYRHPGILVKTVTTLDVLSGGRAYLGIGAAWNEQESKGLGVPFPPLGVRFEQLEETLQIARQMWSGSDAPYHDKHFQLERTLCSPQPLSRPHPPILVAGGGEKKTLRMVAQYADACNLYGAPEAIAAKLEILKQHCGALGRDYGSIEKTTLAAVDLSPGKTSAAEVVEQCRVLAAMGVQHALFYLHDVHELRPLEIFGRDVIPAVSGF